MIDFATLMEEATAFESDHFMLHQNYPNPFSDQTTIDIDITSGGYYSLTLYDITGRKVAVLADNEKLYKGRQTFTLDAAQLKLASNTYYYSLQKGNEVQTKKLLLR